MHNWYQGCGQCQVVWMDVDMHGQVEYKQHLNILLMFGNHHSTDQYTLTIGDSHHLDRKSFQLNTFMQQLYNVNTNAIWITEAITKGHDPAIIESCLLDSETNGATHWIKEVVLCTNSVKEIRDAFNQVIDQHCKVIATHQILWNLVLELVDGKFTTFALKLHLTHVDISANHFKCQICPLFLPSRIAYDSTLVS